MITAKEALELTNQANNHMQDVGYYMMIADEKIKAAAKNGERNCIVDIDNKKLGYLIAGELLYILTQNEFNVRLCNQGYKKYGLWIFW